MDIYHYSYAYRWGDIQNVLDGRGAVPGLRNRRRVCKINFIDEGATDGAVFGLLDSEPAEWVDNTEFPVAWKYLMHDVGRLLLSYEPTEEIVEKSFVIDWAHMERSLGGHKNDIGSSAGSEDSLREERQAAERAYWASRVPLSDYIDNPSIIDKTVLPEVITMCVVPASLVRIADTQPRLQNMDPYDKETLLSALNTRPELELLSVYL